MTNNVVPITEGVIPLLGRVSDPDVIEKLRWALERAEAGEITGVAIGMHFSDGLSNSCFGGQLSYGTLGYLLRMQHDILKNMT